MIWEIPNSYSTWFRERSTAYYRAVHYVQFDKKEGCRAQVNADLLGDGLTTLRAYEAIVEKPNFPTREKMYIYLIDMQITVNRNYLYREYLWPRNEATDNWVDFVGLKKIITNNSIYRYSYMK